MNTEISQSSKSLPKESLFNSEYRKTHPHWWMCLSSEALLVVLLTTGGYAISQTISPDISSVLLGRSGATVMSAQELVKHIEDRRISVYWLGATANSRYSIICNQPGVQILSIFPPNANASAKKKAPIVIETFANSSAANTHTALDANSITQISLATLDRTAKYDPSWRREVDVVFASSPEIVHIHYATTQTTQTMLNDANRLEKVE